LVGQEGEDTESFAFQMRDMFNRAGFGTDASAGAWGITRDPTALSAPYVGHPNPSVSVVIIYYDTNLYSPESEYNYVVATNNKQQPINISSDNEKVYEAIAICFKQVGIKVGWMGITQWVKPGEFEIYIPLKNQ
jgi:hypothetical protein